jgi:hypothetical protein
VLGFRIGISMKTLERPNDEGIKKVMFLGGIQNGHPITLPIMVHTSGRAAEIDLMGDLTGES